LALPFLVILGLAVTMRTWNERGQIKGEVKWLDGPAMANGGEFAAIGALTEPFFKVLHTRAGHLSSCTKLGPCSSNPTIRYKDVTLGSLNLICQLALIVTNGS
jgi:hypothetical protein